VNHELKQQFVKHVRGQSYSLMLRHSACQLFKKQQKKYGHLPPKEAEELPWSRVNVEMIGPYIVRTPKSTHTLRALTMIDPVTGWFEVITIPDKNAHTVMEALSNTWFI
jgi:hypothetical protein